MSLRKLTKNITITIRTLGKILVYKDYSWSLHVKYPDIMEIEIFPEDGASFHCTVNPEDYLKLMKASEPSKIIRD